MFDGDALGQQMVEIVRGYVADQLEPLRVENEELRSANAALVERIAVIEAREWPVAVKGDPGEVDMDLLRQIVVGEVGLAVAALPAAEPGPPGQDVDMEAVVTRIDDAVRVSVCAAMASLPAPMPGEPGKDGVGLADALIDREGALVLTMTDGRMKNLGQVVGSDGKDGVGEPGRDGRDLDDITVTQDGAAVELAFQVGDVRSVFEIELPVGPAGEDGRDAYPGEAKGLYDPAATYRALDVVSFNGSEWRARQDDPGELPGAGWMLSACKGKRGEPGKEGKAVTVEPSGAGIVAAYVREGCLVLTREDAEELIVDMKGIE